MPKCPVSAKALMEHLAALATHMTPPPLHGLFAGIRTQQTEGIVLQESSGGDPGISSEAPFIRGFYELQL